MTPPDLLDRVASCRLRAPACSDAAPYCECVAGELSGGYRNRVLRTNDVVQRGPMSAYSVQLLRFLAEREWRYAPRVVSADESCSVVSFVDGEAALSWDAQRRIGEPTALVAVATMVRELHDLTAGTPLATGAEVACHNDLDPRNTIYRWDAGPVVPVAFIDWDLAGPGARVHDLAHVCWTFSGLRLEADADLVKRQIRTVVEAYGWDGSLQEVVDSMLWWQERCWKGIIEEAHAGSVTSQAMINDGIVAEIQRDYEWTRRELASL